MRICKNIGLTDWLEVTTAAQGSWSRVDSEMNMAAHTRNPFLRPHLQYVIFSVFIITSHWKKALSYGRLKDQS